VAELGVFIGITVALPVALGVFWGFRRYILPLVLGPSSEDKKKAEASAKAMRDLGIQGFIPQLEGSIFEPSGCMEATERKLYFMGILGSKWVIEPHVRSEFVAMLKRVAARKGVVQFLLIDPAGPYFDRLRVLRDGAISTEPIAIWRELALEHDCLEVRLYNQWPCFRLIFLDGNTLVVSRYKTDREGYSKTKFGWEAPHMVLSTNKTWSLFDAFDLYYDQVWENARDVALLPIGW